MPAAFAAAASPSTLAPASDGSRRLMIEAKPIFFSSGTASGVVAPPQATVVSSLAKFWTPGTGCLVTCCADAAREPNVAATTTRRANLISMCSAPSMKGPIIVQAAAVFAMRRRPLGDDEVGEGFEMLNDGQP